jgi:hypothetical protein
MVRSTGAIKYGARDRHEFMRMWPQQINETMNTHVINGPLDFVCQHAIHRRDDLHGHIDQTLAEHQADVI